MPWLNCSWMHADASSGVEPGTLLSVIANTLCSKAVDIELSKVERMGSLALAIFNLRERHWSFHQSCGQLSVGWPGMARSGAILM